MQRLCQKPDLIKGENEIRSEFALFLGRLYWKSTVKDSASVIGEFYKLKFKLVYEELQARGEKEAAAKLEEKVRVKMIRSKKV